MTRSQPVTSTVHGRCCPRSSAATRRDSTRRRSVERSSNPSPNAGVAEAAFAGALGLRLGGETRYGDRIELRPLLGDGRPPERPDIRRASRLSRDVMLALAGVLAAAGALQRVRR